MPTRLLQKSTVEEIRRRFDADVERFSDLEAGQAATVDAPLAMQLITKAALAATPKIDRILDLGCGAGNNTICLLRAYRAEFACDLCDLSLPMLARARERVSRETTREIRTFPGDFRGIDFRDAEYDVVIAAAVLHHLRDDNDWERAFRRVFQVLRPGGSFWITDLVEHENDRIQALMRDRYGDYLISCGGGDYREKVFGYIDAEDSPRSVVYQIDLMRRAGFRTVEILHKNSCFAAFGAIKSEV